MGGPGSGRGTSASAAPRVKCMLIASIFGGGSSEPSVVDLAQSASTNARRIWLSCALLCLYGMLVRLG